MGESGIGGETCHASLVSSLETPSPSSPLVDALHSVIVEVDELEDGLADYTRLLGRRADAVESAAGDGTRRAWFALDNTRLELRERSGATGRSDPTIARGLVGLRFEASAAFSAAALSRRGAKLERVAGPGRFPRIELASSRGLSVEIVDHPSALPSAATPPAVADPVVVDPRARVRSLDHVVVLSTAPDATRAFYADTLGIRLALDKRFEERGVRLIFFRVGGTTVEIGSRLGPAPAPDRPDRFGGLAWQVVDLAAIHARLVAAGFELSEIRTGHKPGTRVCTVHAPVHRVPTLLIEPVA